MHPWLAQRTAQFDSSGIRKVFDLAAKMKDPINLSIGQPDFPVPDAIKDLVINFRVKGSPQGDVEARMAAGRFLSGFGSNAPTTINLPFDVARKMIVENDQDAAMQAFMSGQIQVEGDMTRLMAM